MASVSDTGPLSRWQSSEQGANGSETGSPYPPIRTGQVQMSEHRDEGYFVKVQNSPWWAGGA